MRYTVVKDQKKKEWRLTLYDGRKPVKVVTGQDFYGTLTRLGRYAVEEFGLASSGLLWTRSKLNTDEYDPFGVGKRGLAR